MGKVWVVFLGDCEGGTLESIHLTKDLAIKAAEKYNTKDDLERAGWKTFLELSWRRVNDTEWNRDYEYREVQEFQVEE